MRFSSRRLPAAFFCATTIALTGVGAPAFAQEPAPAVAPDDTADACFSAAERAQPLLRQKKFREARALLEICGRDVCPRVARTDCREWLAEATDAQPSIVIAGHEVRDGTPGRGGPHDVTRDVTGLRAVIDDALVVDRVDSSPIVIDPGHHRLRLERAGADPLVEEIDVREGEKGRVLDVYWHVAAPALPLRPTPPAVFVAGAIGLVAIGVGTYFEIAGLSQRHDLDTSCKPTGSCTESQVNSARTQMRVGDITLGGGILVLAGAMVLYLTRPVGEPAPEKDQSAWLGLVPGGFVAGARGSL